MAFGEIARLRGMTGKREIRLIKLESMLLSGPIHRSVIAAKLEVNAMTVRRDIKRLRVLGSDVEYIENKNGTFASDGWYAKNAVFSDNLML